jgi:hypothetical protein
MAEGESPAGVQQLALAGNGGIRGEGGNGEDDGEGEGAEQ